jgi:hypothetical protein
LDDQPEARKLHGLEASQAVRSYSISA